MVVSVHILLGKIKDSAGSGGSIYITYNNI
jgi:hypothetical protein